MEKDLLSALLPLLQVPSAAAGQNALREKLATKALLAVSSLVRNFTPAFRSFVAVPKAGAKPAATTTCGVHALLALIAWPGASVSLTRKAVSLLQYVLMHARDGVDDPTSAAAAQTDSKTKITAYSKTNSAVPGVKVTGGPAPAATSTSTSTSSSSTALPSHLRVPDRNELVSLIALSPLSSSSSSSSSAAASGAAKAEAHTGLDALVRCIAPAAAAAGSDDVDLRLTALAVSTTEG